MPLLAWWPGCFPLTGARAAWWIALSKSGARWRRCRCSSADAATMTRGAARRARRSRVLRWGLARRGRGALLPVPQALRPVLRRLVLRGSRPGRFPVRKRPSMLPSRPLPLSAGARYRLVRGRIPARRALLRLRLVVPFPVLARLRGVPVSTARWPLLLLWLPRRLPVKNPSLVAALLAAR